MKHRIINIVFCLILALVITFSSARVSNNAEDKIELSNPDCYINEYKAKFGGYLQQLGITTQMVTSEVNSNLGGCFCDGSVNCSY